MAACRGRGLRVDRPQWTLGRRPRPRTRVFAAFGLVRQWVASAIWFGPGRAAWPVSTHAPGTQPHRRPVRHRPRRCRWRSFALSFRRGSALVLLRRTAAPRSVDEGLAVVVLRDKADVLAAAHVVGTHQAQRPMLDVLDFSFHGVGRRPHRDVRIPAFNCLHPGQCECGRAVRMRAGSANAGGQCECGRAVRMRAGSANAGGQCECGRAVRMRAGSANASGQCECGRAVRMRAGSANAGGRLRREGTARVE